MDSFYYLEEYPPAVGFRNRNSILADELSKVLIQKVKKQTYFIRLTACLDLHIYKSN